MTAQLLLVRHAAHADLGHALSGRGGGGLTECGQRQAERLAERLAAFEPAALYASPRLRAVATADLLAARFGLVTRIEPALDEIDFGDWTGRAFAELAGNAAWDRWNHARAHAAPPNGESMSDATARMVAVLDELAVRHSGAAVVIVSHGDMIKGALAHHLGLSLNHILRFDVAPASFSRLLNGPWGAQVLSINECAA